MARQPALTPAAAKAAMAAGVKTAAIVNYEKYVTHPVPATLAKKDTRPKAKAGPKAAVHHAPVNHAALKPKGKSASVAAAKNTAASHPTASPPPVAVATGQKKPSAAIPKETPQN
jgi:hypothetical protein